MHNRLVSLCTPCAVCTTATLRLRSVYVPSTFRLRSVLMLSLLCLFYRLRSNVCVPLHAFHDMPSNAFRHMRPSVCFQLHVFNCMRSTRCVPLYAFHCVSSTVLSEYMRSTVCVPPQNPNVLDPRTNRNSSVRTNKSRSICIGSTYKPETVSKDEPTQEAFALDSRTNQTPSVRTNHLRTHM